jgi:carbon storage regulator
MLVLSRRLNESIKVGDEIRIVVLSVKNGVVRIGIDAPKEQRILREELEEEGREILRRIR